MSVEFRLLARHFSPSRKRKLKSLYHRAKKKLIGIGFSYSYSELVSALRSLGVNTGDVLMVHSSFSPHNGYRGSPQDVIRALREVVGPNEGTLLMVSLPYGTSTYEYLKKTEVFDVKRTVSMMGLISESFRRQKDVLRSAHPTHPVLASGPRAGWIVQDHEKCLYGCGPGSPFEKLAQLDGKVLFFDVPFGTFTFIHYLEHTIAGKLPFPLYAEDVFEVTVVKGPGVTLSVEAKAFSSDAVRRRRPEILQERLRKQGNLKEKRIGMTRLKLVRVRDAMACVERMNGAFFYEL